MRTDKDEKCDSGGGGDVIVISKNFTENYASVNKTLRQGIDTQQTEIWRHYNMKQTF
jgi:hypothetical protein